MGYQNIPERSLEPPEDVLIGYCTHCGDEIYGNDWYCEVDGKLVHNECLSDFEREHPAGCLRTVA